MSRTVLYYPDQNAIMQPVEPLCRVITGLPLKENIVLTYLSIAVGGKQKITMPFDGCFCVKKLEINLPGVLFGIERGEVGAISRQPAIYR